MRPIRITRPRLELLERRSLLATLHVDIHEAACSSSGPVFCQIQEAIDIAEQDDRIEVAAGVYDSLVIDVDGLEIVADSNARAVIGECGSIAAVNVLAIDVTFQGFELRNGLVVDTGSSGNTVSHLTIRECFVGIIVNGHENSFSDNTITNNSWLGFWVNGTGNTFYRNTANDNGGSPLGGAGFLMGGSENTYFNNVANNNEISGFALNSSDDNLEQNTANGNGDAGFRFGIGSFFNTLIGNTANENAKEGFALYSNSLENRLEGNTAIDNGSHGFAFYDHEIHDSSPTDGDFNVFFGNTSLRNGGFGFFVDAKRQNQFAFNECRRNESGSDNEGGQLCLAVTEDHVFGDTNGDRRFDSADLIFALAAGLYETEKPATYAQGDWNDDGEFNSTDLVEALAAGRFEEE